MSKMGDRINCENEFKVYENVIDYLKSDRPEMSDLDFDEYELKMVVAPMQSGKTSMIMSKAIEHAMNGLNVVIVVRNFEADMVQLERRLGDFILKLNALVTNKKIKGKKVRAKIRNVNSVAQDELIKDEDNGLIQGTIILMMGSVKQYEKMDNKIERIIHNEEGEELRQMVMLIDEVDIQVKSNGSKLGKKLFRNAHWNVIQRVGVTATALGSLLSDNKMNGQQIIMLDPPSTYKGVDNISMSHALLGKTNGNGNALSNEIVNVYDNIAWTDHKYEDANGRSHPVIVLNKTATLNNDQYEIAEFCYDRYNQERVGGKKNVNDWFHLVSNGKGVRVYCDTNLRKLDTDSKGRFIKQDEEYIGEESYYDFDEDISTVLQIIKTNLRNNWTKRDIQKTVINIIGGMCFSRGISVVSRDYKWHITGEIYLPGDQTSVGNIMQGLRVCGVFNDNIGLKLWTTEDVALHIKAYGVLQKDLIGKMKDENSMSVKEALDVMVAFEDKTKEKSNKFKIKRIIGKGSDGKDVKLKYTQVKMSTILIDGKPDEQLMKKKMLAKNGITCDDNGMGKIAIKGNVTKISRK